MRLLVNMMILINFALVLGHMYVLVTSANYSTIYWLIAHAALLTAGVLMLPLMERR